MLAWSSLLKVVSLYKKQVWLCEGENKEGDFQALSRIGEVDGIGSFEHFPDSDV